MVYFGLIEIFLLIVDYELWDFISNVGGVGGFDVGVYWVSEFVMCDVGIMENSLV